MIVVWWRFSVSVRYMDVSGAVFAVSQQWVLREKGKEGIFATA